MRVLAVETSSMLGSTALLDDERLLIQAPLPDRMKVAQSLFPSIQQGLAQIGWRPADLDLIAVSQGPGSFTGLRVGVTAAKTLAYATGAAVLGVNTLEVIAAQAPHSARLIAPVLDAQRGQLFAALLQRKSEAVEELEWVETTHVIDRDRWLEQLAPGVTATGAGLKGLLPRLPAGVQAAPEETWTPTAAQVGRLGAGAYRAGRRDDVWRLAPQYYRDSAAEEKARGRAK